MIYLDYLVESQNITRWIATIDRCPIVTNQIPRTTRPYDIGDTLQKREKEKLGL